MVFQKASNDKKGNTILFLIPYYVQVATLLPTASADASAKAKH